MKFWYRDMDLLCFVNVSIYIKKESWSCVFKIIQMYWLTDHAHNWICIWKKVNVFPKETLDYFNHKLKFLMGNIIWPIFYFKNGAVFSWEILRSKAHQLSNFKNLEIHLIGSTIYLSVQRMASSHELKPKWWQHNGLPHWIGRWLWHWACWHGVHQRLFEKKCMGHTS